MQIQKNFFNHCNALLSINIFSGYKCHSLTSTLLHIFLNTTNIRVSTQCYPSVTCIQARAALMSCKVMVARKVATSWYSNKTLAVFPHLDSQTTLVVMVRSH